MNSVDFSLWLDSLRELPSNATQWQQAGKFVDALALIIAEKEFERARTDELIEAVTSIRERFSEELVFLGIDIESDLSLPTSLPEDTRLTLATASRLENSLTELREAKSTTFERLRIAAESVQRDINALSEVFAQHLSSDVDQGDSDPTVISVDTNDVPVVDLARTEEGHSEAEASSTSTADAYEIEAPKDIDEPANNSSTPDGHSESLTTEGQETSRVERIEPSQLQEADTAKLAPDDLEDPGYAEEVPSLTDSGVDDRPHGIVETTVAAKHYLKSPSHQNLVTLLWALVAEDDLSAAYWIAEYLNQQDHESVPPPSLFKAVIGSRLLSPDSSRFVEDLSNVASNYDDSEATSAQGLLELAASLDSSLISPHSLMLGLLKAPVACPASGGLVAAVAAFARIGEPLRPEYIKGVGESALRQDAINEASAHAENWLVDAPKRKYSSLMWATNVWKHLTGSSGKIREMLAPVITNDNTQAHLVNTIATEWTHEAAIDDINQVNQFLGEGKTPRPQIAGRARNWLLNGIDEARNLAVNWCELVLYENDMRESAQKSNLIQLVHDMRNEVERHAGQAVQALEELTTEANPTDIASAANCALRTVTQVCSSLDVDVGDNISLATEVVQKLNVISRDAPNLDALVSRRLLWCKATGIGDDGIWSEGSLEQIIGDLAESIVASLSQQEAIEQRFRLQDYRFFKILSTGLNDGQRDALKASYTRSRQDSELTLANYALDMSNRIDQAVRDGVIDIDDDNWVNYKLSVADVESSLESEEDILDFPSKFGQLEDLQEGLRTEEHRRHSQLTDEWTEQLSQITHTDVPAIQAWQRKFDAARTSGNIRVMEECVIRLRNHSLGEPLPEASLTDEQYEREVKVLSDFVAFIESIPDVEEYAQASIGLTSLEARIASL